MNEKNYKKRIELQQKLIDKQSGQIKSLNDKIENLNLELKKKDEIIHSVDSLRSELSQNVSDIKKYKGQYEGLIEELKKMKDIMDKDVYKNKWRIIKFLIK